MLTSNGFDEIKREVADLHTELEDAKKALKFADQKIALGIRAKLIVEWDKLAVGLIEIGALICAADIKSGSSPHWTNDLSLPTFGPEVQGVTKGQLGRYRSHEHNTVEDLLKAVNKRSSLLGKATKVAKAVS